MLDEPELRALAERALALSHRRRDGSPSARPGHSPHTLRQQLHPSEHSRNRFAGTRARRVGPESGRSRHRRQHRRGFAFGRRTRRWAGPPPGRRSLFYGPSRARRPGPADRPWLCAGDGRVQCRRTRARPCGSICSAAAAAGQISAGAFETGEQAVAVANSRGLWRYHHSTCASLSTVSMGPSGSGWGSAAASDVAEIDAQAVADEAVGIAARAQDSDRDRAGRIPGRPGAGCGWRYARLPGLLQFQRAGTGRGAQLSGHPHGPAGDGARRIHLG